MRGCFIVTLLVSLLLPAGAVEYYVSPDGSPGGDGSKEKPVDLTTALSEQTPARPGDGLWLLGGTYRGTFTSTLTGEENNYITLRQIPGARATIDGSLTVQGAWATYRDFEVMNSDPDRTAKDRPPGINIFGPHTRFINLVVHDAGVGIGFWTPAEDSEVYGCIIYHNGWQGPDPDRGHGHGIYTQNDKGTKRIVDNILFNQFGWGIHAYTEGGSIKGFHIEGNIIFNSGSATRQGHRYDNILIGGYTPAERITLIANHTYQTSSKEGSNVRLHYEAKNNKDLICKNNYFAGGSLVLAVKEWEKVVMTGNTLYGLMDMLALSLPQGAEASAYTWNNNTYLSGEAALPFSFQDQSLDFESWQKTTGFDTSSRWMPGNPPPQGVHTYVSTNRYERGRAHIAVYNWERKEPVDVDVTDILTVGAKYEVRNVLDCFGQPVASGIYEGQPLHLPMVGTETGPEFNVFVLTTVKGESP